MIRVYYGDGTSYSGPFHDAPPLNVQVVNQLDANGERLTFCGFDYYWFDNGRWYGGDLFGLYDFLMRSGLVKFGRHIRHEDYDRICDVARNDPDFKTPNVREHPAPGRP